MAASLARVGWLARPLAAYRGVLAVPDIRNYAHWNKDWKPGPYPKTPEEREAAAKKYGLRPEDYEPYPDDGFGHGDYPKLPLVSAESKDPYYDYDIPELKRNFAEPVHVDYDAVTEDKWNPQYPYLRSMGYMRTYFFLLMGTIIGIYLLAEPYPHFHAVGKASVALGLFGNVKAPRQVGGAPRQTLPSK